MAAWHRTAMTATGEGEGMVELGFLLLGVGFSIAVAQLFVGRRERVL
jgi:hypothetical protein